MAEHLALLPYPEAVPAIRPRWRPGEYATLTLPLGYLPGCRELEEVWGYADARWVGLGTYGDAEMLEFLPRLTLLRATSIFVYGLAVEGVNWFEWGRSPDSG